MAQFYHGSGILFDRFDLSHALEGDGKVKFGYGVYLTSRFASAAHYSGSNKDWQDHYVYTVEIPEVTPDNTIHFQRPVNTLVINKAAALLGTEIPASKTLNGKDFRKFLAATLLKRLIAEAKAAGATEPAKIEGEKAASALLLKAGVEYIEWPYNWKNPNDGTNIAVLDDSKIRITRVDKIELDEKKKLIDGSEKQVR